MLGFQVLFMALTLPSLRFYALTRERCDEIAGKLGQKRTHKAEHETTVCMQKVIALGGMPYG